MPEQPPIDTVVSIQEKKNGTTILSFHSGTTVVDVKTNASFSTYSYEGSSISKTPNGFRAKVDTIKRKGKGGVDWITVAGKINSITLQQEPPKESRKIHLFINDKLIQTGKQIYWSRKPQQKQVSQVPAQEDQEGGIIQILSDYWPYVVGGVGGLLLLYKLIK